MQRHCFDGIPHRYYRQFMSEPHKNLSVLHVGCGPFNPKALHRTFQSPEWQEVRLDINAEVKPDIVASMTDMSAVASDSMDAVWSSHNLEHLFAHEVSQTQTEFLRVLKPSGFVPITLPDLE